MKPKRTFPGARWWIVTLALIFSAVALTASEPEWWHRREVIDPRRPAQDFAAANQGQVKYFAYQAYLDMQDSWEGGAGESISNMVKTFNQEGNYSPVNLGQLKAVGGLFYSRLNQPPPWQGGTSFSADYAMANLGQVKSVFSFEIPRALVLTCPPDIQISCHTATNPALTGWATATGTCASAATITYEDSVRLPTQSVSIAAWNFPDATADALADGGTEDNIGYAPLATSGLTGSIGFDQSGVATRSANAIGWHNGNGTKAWHVEFSTEGFANLKITSKQYSSPTGPRDFKLQYSLDGLVWADVANVPPVGENWTSGALSNQSLPEAVNNRSIVRLRWIMASDASVAGEPNVVGNTGNSRIDDIQIAGDIVDTRITRTWTAVNSCGNRDRCKQIITVVDSPPPSIACPPDLAINCNESTAPARTGQATASNSLGQLIPVTYADTLVATTQIVSVVEWTFPEAGTPDALADAGSSANNGIAELSTTGGTGAIGYSQAGARTGMKAANAEKWHDGNGSKAWQAKFSAAGYANLRVSSKQNSSFLTGPCDFKLQYSLNGSTWIDVVNLPQVLDNWTSGILINQSLPAAVNNQAAVYLRWIMLGNASVAGGTNVVGITGNSRIADIVVIGNPVGNHIRRTWTAADACNNSASCVQAITVIAKAAPIITCPPDVALACGESSLPGHTGWATATNDSGGFISISYADTNLPPAPNTKVVEWNFPNNPDNAIADGGIAANLSKPLTAVGGTGAIGFTQTGASTYAANAGSWQDGANLKAWQVEFSTVGHGNIRLSSKQISSPTGPRDFKVQYSRNGVTWADVVAVPALGSAWTAGILANVALPEAVNNQASVFVRWIMVNNTSMGGGTVTSVGNSRIDDIVILGDTLSGDHIARIWTATDECGNNASCMQAITSNCDHRDTDGDGLPNWWEDQYSCLDSLSPDALGNPDGDSLNNFQEWIWGSAPC